MTRTGTRIALKSLGVALFATLVCMALSAPAQDTKQEKKPASAPQRAQPAFAQVEEKAGLPRQHVGAWFYILLGL